MSWLTRGLRAYQATTSRVPGRKARSIDDEELCSALRIGTVRFCIVCHLVAHAGFQRERSSVLELGVKLAFRAKEYVALDAPVISEVARRVLNHTHANTAEV